MTFLKYLMTDRALSQPVLARDLRVNQARVSLLASGKAKPSQAERKALEAYFERPVTILLGEI